MNLSNRKTAVLAALVMLVAAAAGGAAAAGVDNETTNTPPTSEVTDGTTITSFNASAQQNSTLTITVSSTNPAVRAINPATNNTVVTWLNTSTTMNQTYADAANNTYYYNLTIQHSDLQYMPINSGQNKSVTLQIVDNETLDDKNETVHNITVYLDGVPGRTVKRVTSDDAGEDGPLTLGSNGYQPLGFSIGVDEYATYDAEDVPINGTNSTITVKYVNESTISRLDTTTEGLSDAAWASGVMVKADGTWYKTYVNSVPDSANTSRSYAIVDPSSNTVTFHAGDGFDGETQVDDFQVKTTTDWGDQWGAYGWELVV